MFVCVNDLLLNVCKYSLIRADVMLETGSKFPVAARCLDLKQRGNPQWLPGAWT